LEENNGRRFILLGFAIRSAFVIRASSSALAACSCRPEHEHAYEQEKQYDYLDRMAPA